MWHVSVSPQQTPLGVATLERVARKEIEGVGDASLGEWMELTGKAFHLRRRLSEVEAVNVGPVVDIRRTPEAARRARALGDRLRFVPPEVWADEIGA